MATRNLKIVESDLSGATDASTVTFGLGDTWYEVDLTQDENNALQKALAAYLEVGRKANSKRPAPRLVPDVSPERREEIREWAKSNGLDVADRGQIPKKIVAAYEEEFGKLPLRKS